MGGTARTILVHYGGAVVFTALAVLVRWLLDPWLGDSLPLVTLFGAVAVAVWLGGYRPALVAAVLGYLACAWLFVEPRGSLGLDNARNVIGLFAYLLSCGFLVGFGEAMHAARRRFESKKRRLERAESLLGSVIDNAPVGIAIFDTDLRFVRLNDQAARADGLAKEDHIGKTVLDLFPDLGPNVQARLRHVLDTGEPVVGVEMSGETPAQPGQQRHWLANYFPIRTPDGRTLGVGAIALEVTEKKRAEATLRESERRERERAAELETILRATPTAIWIAHDPECRTITGNPAAYELLRMTEGTNVSATGEAAMGRRYQEYRDDQPIPPNELPMQKAAAAGVEVHDAELKLVFEDGMVRFIYGNAVPLRGDGGTVRGSVAAFVDITERTNAEKRLRLLWEAAAVLLTTDQPDAMMRALFTKIAPHFGLDAYFNFMVEETGEGLRLSSCQGIP